MFAPSPAAEHLLRSSLLPALECLKLYNQCDDDGTQLPRVAPPEPDVEESGASVAVGRTPSDFFVFPGLRELTIDEGGTRHGSGRPWGEWYAFRHLSSLESLTWIGDYKCGLRGDARDALPALSGLRHLSLHSACRCPQGLAELQRMESLSATIGTGCGDSLGEWDLRGLRALRQAVFQGRGFGGLTHLPRMDASLTALERFCLVDARVPLQVAEAARDGPAGAGGGAPPSQQPKQQAQAAADTTAAAAEGQLDPLRDVFQAWVAPCHVLPSIAVVEVWYPLFMSAEGDFTGQLAINPRAGSWFGGGDGARWRARVWSYKGKGEYGEVTEPRMLRVVAGIPVEGMEGGAAQRLWLKLAFERV
ncbi:hypothetical protein HXX76_008644 [Chlamydomonas incerta]|uniref:Uncharacterized protein n=1 Tax=Chlamydomonas incerta TaxID=51695 RepID=A0A835W0V3_CHLIN|nr:hypothetical protein HXX76_008644 [Chlamydomonas incerta]|eukprot:KAG2432914.1 hypothetical protein HXX76_008644 [Chlamydomonas incerta]